MKSDFLNIVKERGFVQDCTAPAILQEQLLKGAMTAYIGFDCTAPSLHVGSLIQIMILRWLQKCGHQPIVLMGGGTTKIGDPSGKDETRKILTEEEINNNLKGIKSVFKKFIHFEETGGNAIMVNNDDWLSKLNLIEFLRDYGQHFSVNRMMSMDSVKLRLEREHHLSLLEFMYMAMQAYDFAELKRKYNCRLQIGGSDQWGNIVNGIELYRRLHTHPDNLSLQDNSFFLSEAVSHDVNDRLFGLTTPLITTASGAKMGKTAGGAVWLNADRLSPYDYWQFWRNTEDADVGRFLRFFTELPMGEIQRLETLQGVEINEAKKILANEATRLCHGGEAAKAAAETARKTFEEGGAGENLKTFYVDKSTLETGIPAYELFHLAGLKESKGEARKLIEGGGGRINDEKITDPRMKVTFFHMTSNGYIKLSAGKKHHLLIHINKA